MNCYRTKFLMGACTVFLWQQQLLAQNTASNTFMYAYQKNEVSNQRQKKSLFSILNELNKEKGIYFMYSDSLISEKQVNIPVNKETSIENILTQILKNTGLKFRKLSSNTFIISIDKKETSYNNDLINGNDNYVIDASRNKINASIVYSDKKISGKIVNAKDGIALEGVTVVVKGKKTGTFTNADGSFSILADEDATIEFSRVGFVTLTLKANQIITNKSIALQEAENNLTDVVVAAYGSQKRSSYTGSAVTLRNQMFEDVPRSSIQESFQGTIAGVQASNGSGQPGTPPSIRVRGIGSINASSAPLYVIDGVPVVSGDISNGYGSNTIASLNPSDIQSTVILKDASATALYGSRGANGVILITTKKGRTGKTRFNFNIQQGINLYTLRDKDKMMTTQQTIQYLREGWANAGKDPLLFDAEIAANGVDTTKNTDWFNEILSPGNYTRVNLSASGGTSKTTFFTSGSLYKQDAVQDGVDYDRVTSMFNLNHKESDKFQFHVNFGATYQRSNSFRGGTFFDNPVRAMYRLQPWLTVYNNDGTFRTDYNSGYNPVAIAQTNIRRTNTYIIRSNIGATYNFTKWLSYETKLGIDYSHAFNTLYRDPNYGNANIAAGGISGNYAQDIVNWVYTNIVRTKKQFKNHSIEAFAGYEATKRTDSDLETEVRNIMPGLTTSANGTLPTLSIATNTASSIVSSFLNTSYDYNGKYHLTASVRYDGSSRFGKDNRYGLFWSIGGAWVISKENFLKADFINELKLRASYGATGNSIGLNDFGALGLYNTNGAYNLQNGSYYNQIRNDSLTWEKNYPLNIGLDFVILKGRIAGTLEYYSRKTTDLLLTVPVPATNGISGYTDNFGAMSNKGFEVSLATVNILPKKSDGLKWTSEFTFSTNQNKILKLNFAYTTNSYYRAEGQDFYQWRMKTFAGVDPNNGQALWFTDSAKSLTTNSWSAGRFLLQGSALPKFYGGMMHQFAYKKFTLMFHIFYNWGNKIFDDNGEFIHTDGSMGFGNTSVIPVYDFNNRWRKQGDITNVPAPVYLGTQTGLNTQVSSRFLYDGSYVRLRDIQLSYNVKGRFITKTRLNSMRFYVRANNLITWVKDKQLIYDPETPVDGTISQRPPIFKTILAGVDINF